jgi:uncharacterized protein (TIGR04168 family)
VVASEPSLRIGVVGDVHLHFDDRDAELLDAQSYDQIVFVGDLAGYKKNALGVARSIARLSTPALVIPGNHDAASLPHLAAETLERRRLARLLGAAQPRRVRELARALAPAKLAGYELVTVAKGELALSLIVARPHSQGGGFFAFSRQLETTFGVKSLEDSAKRLCALVDDADQAALVFLAHNGPTGLGARRTDIWGCDFRAAEGDWGDEDLRLAIEHARSRGKRVLAVLAGHMHHRLKGGGERCQTLERDGTLYLNAARVPRIEKDGMRSHYCFETDGETAQVRLVRERG